jgi:hypothetical protein
MSNTAPLANLATVAINIAAHWAAERPELTDRLNRAVSLVHGVEAVGPAAFTVPGSKAPYLVKVDRAAKSAQCECPDHANRGVRCKHILAAALFEVASKKLERLHFAA